MRYPKVITLLCLLLAVSYVLPWASGPFGNDLSPYSIMSDFGLRRLADAPLEVGIFIGTFALAALTGLLSLLWSAPRLLVILTGALPFAIVARIVLHTRDEFQKIGVPMPDWRDLGRALGRIDIADSPGLALYFGAAGLLLLLALLVPGRR